MKKTNNKGFSLVELIVVIAIMAVLVVAVAPQFLKYVERARKSTDVQTVATVVTSIQTYSADPMVDVAKQIATGEKVVISATADPDFTNGANIKLAMEGAGVDKVRLKSTKWGDGTAASVTLTATVDGSGNIKITADTDGKDNDILAGKYK